MSGHGANSIFFNKNNEDRTSRSLSNLPTPIPLRPIISHFRLTPIPPQSGTHICITPKSISMGVDHKCFCHYLRLVSLYFAVKLEKDKYRDLS